MIDTTYPSMSTDEIVALLGGEAGAEMVRIENARRREQYDGWRLAEVHEHMGAPLPGGPLVVGRWYDVSPGGGYERGRKWRVCRYVGRTRSRRQDFTGEPRYYESYVFERWGAKAATDPFARRARDSVGTHSRGFSVDPIEVDPRVAEKASVLDAARGPVRE